LISCNGSAGGAVLRVTGTGVASDCPLSAIVKITYGLIFEKELDHLLILAGVK
jgi:hypothetical protein